MNTSERYKAFDDPFGEEGIDGRTADDRILYEILRDVVPYYIAFSWREPFRKRKENWWKGHLDCWLFAKQNPPAPQCEKHDFIVRCLDLLDQKFGTILTVLSLIGAAAAIGTSQLWELMVPRGLLRSPAAGELALFILIGALIHILFIAATLKHHRGGHGGVWHLALLSVQFIGWGLYLACDQALFLAALYLGGAGYWLWNMRERVSRVILVILIIGLFVAMWSSNDRPSGDTGVAVLLWFAALTWLGAMLLALRGAGRLRWGAAGYTKESHNKDVEIRQKTEYWEQNLIALERSIILRSVKYRTALLLMFVHLAVVVGAGLTNSLPRLLAGSNPPNGQTGRTSEPTPPPSTLSPLPSSHAGPLAVLHFAPDRDRIADTEAAFMDVIRLLESVETEKPRAIFLRASVDGQRRTGGPQGAVVTNAGLALGRLDWVREVLRQAGVTVPIIGRIRDATQPGASSVERSVEVYFLP